MLVRIKLKEWLTAIKLERRYTKEQIIALYLNKFDFIYEAHGIQTASQTYFGKTQDKLKIEEAATLIGMLKNPTLYNPRKFPELAKERRNTVLALMEQKDHISKTELNSLMNTGMDVRSKSVVSTNSQKSDKLNDREKMRKIALENKRKPKDQP